LLAEELVDSAGTGLVPIILGLAELFCLVSLGLVRKYTKPPIIARVTKAIITQIKCFLDLFSLSLSLSP
jgi:hypothetical protein